MKFGTSVLIFFLAIVALVAELILYFVVGLGAAFSADVRALSGAAFFFVSLMLLTAATGILAPICAVIELVARKKNLGLYIMLPALGVILGGLVIFGATAPSALKEAKPQQEEREAEPLGLRWSYEESPDTMGRGTIKTASIRSLKEFQFGFPYQGAQRARLQLRVHPKYGKDVILSIERGQFLCGIDSCNVGVRFDEGKTQTYTAVEPADHRTTALFLRNYDRFLANARKSKKAYVEAEFYQEGPRVFEFDIAGLKW